MSSATAKSNGKKRKFASPDVDTVGSHPRVETVKDKKEKKKRRKAVNKDGDAEEEQQAQPTKETSRAHKKKKSKAQDNGQPETHNNPPPNDPQVSTADFLSIISAAATSPSDPSQPGPSTSAAPPPAPIPDLAAQTGELFSGDVSSESVLRALQDVDITKIAHLLRSLADSQQASVDPLASLSAFFTDGTVNAALITQLMMHQEPPPLNQVPVSAGKILGTKPTETATGPTYSHDVIENHNTAEDALLLSTKWMSPAKLAGLSKSRGLVYKKGKFSAIEEQQLNSAIERYALARQITPDQLHDVIFPSDEKAKDNAFWSEITRAVPQRPIISVYHHVRRSHHPLKQQGKWLPAEDDKLKEAVARLGNQWEKISVVVGRRAPDCRDRWRNHIVGRDVRVNGPWSIEEEDELTRIVEEMTIKQGGTLDDDLFWGAVSDKMGNKRNRQQCRIKWTDGLSKRVKTNGQDSRWSNQDAYILVHKLDSLRVRDDTEIDWKTLADEDWNLWSAHVLQRRWLTMKRGIKGYEEMSMQEIMEILKAKKTNFDPTPDTTRKPRKNKKYPSAEMVADSDDED